MLHDGTCPLCRLLASALQRMLHVRAIPLQSQEAQDLLRRAYGNGWKWQWYWFEDRTLYSGVYGIARIIARLWVRLISI